MRNLLLAITLSLGMVSTMPLAVYGQRLSVGDLDKLDIVDTVADLADARCQNGGKVQTLGFYAAGDNGGNIFIYRSTGRSGVTLNGFYVAGPGADDYFEVADKSKIDAIKWGMKTDGTPIDSLLDSALAYASANKVPLIFPSGTFTKSASTTMPDDVTMLGAGKYNGTKIVQTDETSMMFDVQATQNFRCGHMEITQDATPDDSSFGRAFYFGLGSGELEADYPKDIHLHDLYLHNFTKHAVTAFAGVVNFTVERVHVDQCGRAGMVFNGLRGGTFSHCLIGATGDDGLAFNNVSNHVIVSSCRFVETGTLNGNGYAAVKTHGGNVVIDGNVFERVAKGIYLKGHAQSEDGFSDFNGATQVVISNNVVSSIHNDSLEKYCLDFQKCSNIRVSDNVFCAFTENGGRGDTFNIEGCVGLRSSGNLYIGNNGLRLPNAGGRSRRDLKFTNDTFHCSLVGGNSEDDLRAVEISDGTAIEDITFDKCRFSETCISIVKMFGGSVKRLSFLDPEIDRNVPLGHLASNVLIAGGEITEIPLKVRDGDNNVNWYDGPRLQMDAGQKIFIVVADGTGYSRQELTVADVDVGSYGNDASADIAVPSPGPNDMYFNTTTGTWHDRNEANDAWVNLLTGVKPPASEPGDASITVNSFTPTSDYVAADSWVAAWAVDDAPDAFVFMSSGATMELLEVRGDGRYFGGYTKARGSGSADIDHFRFDRGPTTDRPDDLTGSERYEYFDTTLGHPIWWDGAGWVDATGATP